MRTKEDFMKALSKMKKNIYFNGERIDRLDERQMPCIDTIGTTYDVVEDPDFKDVIFAKSHMTGDIINRFTHIHQNTEDLHKKQDLTRKICQKYSGQPEKPQRSRQRLEYLHCDAPHSGHECL